MSSKINLQTCEYARKSSIFQDNQLILGENQYIYAVLIFAVVGAVSVCGVMLYQRLSKAHAHKGSKSEMIDRK